MLEGGGGSRRTLTLEEIQRRHREKQRQEAADRAHRIASGHPLPGDLHFGGSTLDALHKQSSTPRPPTHADPSYGGSHDVTRGATTESMPEAWFGQRLGGAMRPFLEAANAPFDPYTGRVDRHGHPIQAGFAPVPHLGILGRLISGAGNAALGFPAGVVKTVLEPKQTAEGIAHQYAAKYGHRDLGTILHNISMDPTGTLLDAFTIASLGAGGAARLGALDRPAALRTLSSPQAGHGLADGLTAAPAMSRSVVHPFASPNTLTRIGQHGLDRYSEALQARANLIQGRRAAGVEHPLGPVGEHLDTLTAGANRMVGADARIARRLKFARERDFGRHLEQNAPLDVARRHLSKPEDVAFDVLRRYGVDGEAPGLLQQEIAMRQQRLSEPITKNERDFQQFTLHKLEQAVPHVQNPSVRLLAAHHAGEQLMGERQQLLAGLPGGPGPDALQGAVDRSARLVTGGQYETSGATPALEDARATSAGLQARYDAEYAKAHERLTAQHQRLGAKLEQRVAQTRQALEEQKNAQTPEQMQAELAANDKTWTQFVQGIHKEMFAPKQTAEDARAQLERNKINGIIAKGPGTKGYARAVRQGKQVKVSAANWKMAEDEAIRRLEASSHPLAKKMLDHLSEGDRLRLELGKQDLGAAVPRAQVNPQVLERSLAGLEQKLAEHRDATPPLVGPMGSPTVQRLGGALSVAGDRVQRLEQNLLARDGAFPDGPRDTQLVGGQPPGEGAYYGPDLPWQKRRGLGLSRSTRAPRVKQLVHGTSTGTLFREGRAVRGSEPVVVAGRELARFRQGLADQEQLRGFASPVGPDGKLLPKHTYLNPNGVPIPRSLQELEHLRDLHPNELRDALHSDVAEYLRSLFPGEQDIAKLTPHQQSQLMQIPERIKHAYEDNNWAGAQRLGHAIDTANSAAKFGFIYGKGAYIPVNAAGNVMFLGLHQHIRAPYNLMRAGVLGSDRLLPKSRRLSGETKQRLDYLVGEGPSRALKSEGVGRVNDAFNRVADFSSKLADRKPRRAAIIDEIAKLGAKTDDEIRALLDDSTPHGRAVIEQAAQEAEEAMVRFRGLSPFERRIASRILFIYPWTKGSTRYMGRLALDRPGAAAASYQLGEYGSSESKKKLGNLPKYLAGLVPLGDPHSKLGSTVATVFNPAPLTPLGTGADVIDTLAAHDPRHLPIDFTSPPVKAALEGLTKHNFFTGRDYKLGTDYNQPGLLGNLEIAGHSLLGSLGSPALPLARQIQTVAGHGQTEPFAGPSGSQKNWVGEGGRGHGLLGGILEGANQLLLGGAHVRELNIPAANTKAQEDALTAMPAPQRAAARVDMEVGSWKQLAKSHGVRGSVLDTPAFQQAVALRKQRQAAYAQAAKAAHVPANRFRTRDRYKVDLQLLVSRGTISRQAAEAWQREADTMTDTELEQDRSALLSDYFANDVYADGRDLVSQLKEADQERQLAHEQQAAEYLPKAKAH